MVMLCIPYLHTHTSAAVRACRHAGVDKNEFKHGVISVRAWSAKRALSAKRAGVRACGRASVDKN